MSCVCGVRCVCVYVVVFHPQICERSRGRGTSPKTGSPCTLLAKAFMLAAMSTVLSSTCKGEKGIKLVNLSPGKPSALAHLHILEHHIVIAVVVHIIVIGSGGGGTLGQRRVGNLHWQTASKVGKWIQCGRVPCTHRYGQRAVQIECICW